MVNILFLLFYVIGYNQFPGEALYYILILQCIINIVVNIREKNPITPLLTFYAGVIITNTADLNLITQLHERTLKTYSYIVPMYIDSATKLWCISTSVLAIGYEVAMKRLHFSSIAIIIQKRQTLTIIFGTIAAFNLLSLLGSGFRLSGSGAFKIIGLMNMMGIVFFARLWAKENSRTFRNYTVILFVLQTYVALLYSFLRSDLIMPSFCLFTGYFIGKGNVKYLLSYRIIPFLVLIGVFASVFSSLHDNRSNFISVFTSENENEQTTKGKSNEFLVRNGNLAQMTNVFKLVNQNGFYNGKASAPLVIALVPRFLWPDKPTIALGTWFALEIGTAYKSETGKINNSVNMTLPGELYLDFGWIGVVIGSLLMGVLAAAFWNATQFYSSAYNLTGALFGGYLFFLSLFGFGGDLQIIITLFSTYLSFLILKRIVSSINQRRG
jgi:hypothetical protein